MTSIAPMKGVILAGGSGTRLHPLTRITNKHLLPLYDRPMVTYAVEALGLAERFVGRDKVCVLLADNIFETSLRSVVENFERQEVGGRIALARLEEDEHLRHLGVAVMDGDRVAQIVEKPDSPPSRFAVTGVYFYDAQVWNVLPSLQPSGRGELEITDVNNWYVERKQMEADVVEGFWGDAGESIAAYYEVNDFVRGLHG